MTPQGAKVVKRHNFGNTSSLTTVEKNWWLTEILTVKWDVKGRIFQFGAIELCSTIKEYARILGVQYVHHFPYTEYSL